MSAYNRGPNNFLKLKNVIDLHTSKSLASDDVILNSQLDQFTLSPGCNDHLGVQGTQYPGFTFGDWNPGQILLPVSGSTSIYTARPYLVYNYHNPNFPEDTYHPLAEAQPTFSNLTGAIISKRNNEIAIKVQGGYQCAHPGCSKVYAQKYSIKRHRETVHVRSDARISCPDCNRTFGYFRELNRHHSKAHGGKCHHCPCLNKWFSRLYLLRGQCPQGARCPGAIDRRKSSNAS